MASTETRDADAAGGFVLRDVVKEREGVRVLDGIDVVLPPAELTGLIGPSGAGKTTLLRLLNRLDDPTSGEVLLDGRPVSEMPVRRLRCRVGFVFQSAVMFPGSVAQNLQAARRLSARTEASASGADWIEGLLCTVELDPGYAAREAARLSGGEKQRVALARALATDPEVLLLDEPTSALDPEVALRLMGTVARLNRERRQTMVMVTHRLQEAREFTTYTVMLEAGRVVEAGPTARLFESASHPRTRAYVGAA